MSANFKIRCAHLPSDNSCIVKFKKRASREQFKRLSFLRANKIDGENMNLKILAFLSFVALNLGASEVSLRQMAAQMIMIGFNGVSAKEASVRAMLSDAGYGRFGGVILLGRNIQNKAQLSALTSAIKSKQPKILIAIDEEGGQISRLKDASFGANYPSALDVATSLDIAQTSELYANMAKNLRECGVNLDFAPVIDLHDDASPIIGAKERAFSPNASKVTFYAGIFVDAFKKERVITTLKHFPGHGGSAQDSHKDKSTVELSKEALTPYKQMIAAGRAQLIMVGHLYIKDVDEQNPASLSHKAISRLLREGLGYEGAVISDDMMMKGSGDDPLSEKVVKFINAGGDILLFNEFKIGNQRTADIVTQYILDAVAQGKISKERIKQSYERIEALKALL